jgi:hypothetical protein
MSKYRNVVVHDPYRLAELLRPSRGKELGNRAYPSNLPHLGRMAARWYVMQLYYL